MHGTWTSGQIAFGAGLLIAVATSPVGVSGAMFLLPGAGVFRLVAECVLLLLGVWLCARTLGRRETLLRLLLGATAVVSAPSTSWRQ